MLIKREMYKNKCVAVSKNENIYIIIASVNGKTVGSFKTEYIEEAQEVFNNTVNAMYA